jgi:hypothetical protein
MPAHNKRVLPVQRGGQAVVTRYFVAALLAPQKITAKTREIAMPLLDFFASTR